MPVAAVPFNLYDESWAINKLCRRATVVDKAEVDEKEDQQPEVQPKVIDLFKSWASCMEIGFLIKPKALKFWKEQGFRLLVGWEIGFISNPLFYTYPDKAYLCLAAWI